MIERIDNVQMSFEMKIPTIEDFKKIAIDEIREAFDSFDRAIEDRITQEIQKTIKEAK